MDLQVGFLKYRIAISLGASFCFFALGKLWIDGVDARYFGELGRFRGPKGQHVRDSIGYVDRLFLVKQLLKFRMLIYVFFFSQLYGNTKALFFYYLNFENPLQGPDDPKCLSLTALVM